MDKLRSMETFVAVVDAGSFTEAAMQLEMSAVMVGKYVRELETRLGARLLQRSTRRQSLTDAGRVFYEDAKRVLEQVRWAETSVERLRAQPSGTLRVSAPTTFGACVIAPLTATFQQAHPQVRVELDLSNRMVDLADEGFDLAVRIGALGDADLVAKPLCAYRMVISASPDYLARHGRPETPADLPAIAACPTWCGTAAMRGSCPAGMARHPGATIRPSAATTATACGWPRSPVRGCCCSRRCWWPRTWRAAGWCACCRRMRRSRDRSISCIGKIGGLCRS